MAPNKCPAHYAAIVVSGKVLTLGASGLAGCSRMCRHAVTRHAEMDAINKIKVKANRRRLRRASMWSVRWKNINGQYILANAKPCLFCRELALRCGIKTVYYSKDDGSIAREAIGDLDSKMTTGSIINLRKHSGYTDLIYKKNTEF